jgi:hypothetical protein
MKQQKAQPMDNNDETDVNPKEKTEGSDLQTPADL